MSSSPPSTSETPTETQTRAPTTDSSSPPPPSPPSDQGGESSGDSERPNSSAAGGDGEKNGGEGEAGEVGEEQEDEEEGECGFCLFMKGGGCKEEFIAWEKCVEEADQTGEDVVSKCFEVTSLLKKCMDAHADYYAPILDAEKAMTDAAATATTTPDSE